MSSHGTIQRPSTVAAPTTPTGCPEDSTGKKLDDFRRPEFRLVCPLSIPSSPEAASLRIIQNLAHFALYYTHFVWIVLFITCNQPEPPQEPSLTPETPTDAEQDETGFSLQALDSNISDQMAPERHKPAKEEVKCKRGGTDEKKDEIPGRLGLNDKAGQMASPASFTIKEEKGQPRGSSDEAKDKQCGRPGFKDPDHAIYH